MNPSSVPGVVGVRAALERRYFGGHAVLFAHAAAAWAELVEMLERLGILAETILPTGHRTTGRRRPGVRDSSEAIEDRVADRVAWLADDARVRAYELLGDKARVVRIIERRLRADGGDDELPGPIGHTGLSGCGPVATAATCALLRTLQPRRSARVGQTGGLGMGA